MTCSIAGSLTPHGALGLLVCLLSLGALAMAIGTTTGVKNSGILRYTFGANTSGGFPREPQFSSLVGGAAATIIQCLGANANVTPDSDDQIFGLCPGHAAITGLASSLFAGSNVTQQNAVTPGQRVLGVNALFDGYIPRGTKVHAYFISTDIAGGVSVGSDMPYPIVQTEVKTGRRWRSGTQDTDGPQFLSSIRLAVQNAGGADTLVAGVLCVELQHSEHDIPDDSDNQDGIFVTNWVS